MLKDRILLVEDELAVRETLSDFLQSRNYDVLATGTSAGAEQLWRAGHPDAAVLDYCLPDGNALDLIPRLKAIDPSIPVIILTGYGSIDLAVEAVKLGADLFLPKPAELSALHLLVQRSLDNRRNHRQQLAERLRSSRGVLDPFLCKSDSIRRLADLAHKLALSDAPVLIRGEAGTGKRTMARWLHYNGSRAGESFIDLNCSRFPGGLLDAELCGDVLEPVASQNHAGLLEIAQKGTVFLDQVENVDLQVQPKLLKIIDEKQFRKLGEVCDRRVDVRFIAATQQVTLPLVLRKHFRDALQYRASWTPLLLPPLRERIEDLPVLSARILGD